MSAILETQPGEELVCIEQFSVLPRGSARQVRARRNFRIGERVRYLGYYHDENLKDNPAGWMVIFEAENPKNANQYAATQTYFMTIDQWVALKRYFAKTLMREPQPNARRVSIPLARHKLTS